jgi:CheY-like chemotaxis protein
MPPSTEGFDARILLVDDQSSNLRLLEQTLRRAAFTEVMSTTEPREVQALHRQHRYDLILLDLQMPEMNGFEVMQQLREIRAEIPVAILVLSADSSQMPAVFEAGADSFLGKPFRLPDVVERVVLMLKKRNDSECADPVAGRGKPGTTPSVSALKPARS